jgi:NAD(P)-dependent dehydrogenase (short-subunit alcohol dehydrogenase family)
MQQLEGKVAVVTGGASGIGQALARRFVADGMRVMLADIEGDALSAAARELREGGGQVAEYVCDVSDESQVIDLATETYEQFGTAHVVCNNAGGGGGLGNVWEIGQAEWDWVFGVNFWGVLNGIRAFVPRLIAQGEGHVVNTASLAGLKAAPFMGPYAATKHAVVAISESLSHELAGMGSPVRVSVLCPGFLRTRIAESDRNWPDALGDRPQIAGTPAGDFVSALVDAGGDPALLADRVSAAIVEERFFVLSEDRHAAVPHLRGKEAAEGSQPSLPQV